jgi:hypothetical protein
MTQSFAQLLWDSNGQPVRWKGKTLMMYHRISLPGYECRLKYRILSATTKWKEGFAIKAGGSLEFDDGQKYGKDWVVIWWEGEPIEQEFVCRSKKKILDVKNVWDTGSGCIDSWYNNSALWVEEIEGGYRYHCNDGRYDEDFDDIVFEILILN